MDQIDDIKARIDIVDFIQSYVPLKRAGASFKGLCPFHNEKTPSFMVSPERHSWHCFGCDIGGDVISFVEKIDGLDFMEAVKMLAERAGVVLDVWEPLEKSRKAILYEIMEAATTFYAEILQQNDTGLEYLKKRGLASVTIKEWRLGLALDSWDNCIKYLSAKGYKTEDIERAGLIIKGDRGFYDRFRGRIIFPVSDLSGKVVAFSGRALGNTEPKYLNSPETLIFKKGAILFGLHATKNTVRKQDCAVLVEGNFDLILPYQEGFQNVIAPCGTALTEEQLTLLSRYTDNILIAFDADEAGQAAAFKAAIMAYHLDLSPRVVTIPNGKDPADAVMEDRSAWQKAIENPEGAMEHFLGLGLKQYSEQTPEAKKKIVRSVSPLLYAMANPVEKADSLRLISEQLRIPLKSLEELQSKHSEISTPAPEARVYKTATPAQIAIGLLYRLNLPVPLLPKALENPEDNALKFLASIGKLQIGSKVLWPDFVKKSKPETAVRLNELAQITEELYSDMTKDEAAKEVGDIIEVLQERRKGVFKRALIYEVKEAERQGNKAKIKELLEKLIKLQ